MDSKKTGRQYRYAALAALVVLLWAPATFAEANGSSAVSADYVVGSQDVLIITSYDQADLTGKFTVETDGTFTFPYIGRFQAGGLSLRNIEETLKGRLKEGGYFNNPQITVSVEQYKSQKVFVIGEVRSPGSYTLSSNINLVEALARAGSTLPTAAAEAVIVHPASGRAVEGPTLPSDGADVVRVDLRALQNGEFGHNAALRDGDTIFVPRAESIYVFGQVKSPGAYPLQGRDTTVLQALSLAGGVADRGSTSRIRVVRIVNGEKKELKVQLTDTLQPGDTLIVPERFL